MEQPQIPVPEYVPRPENQMGFADAVNNAIMYNFGNFTGRASRSEYWWFYLFSFIIGMFTTFADTIIFDTPVAEWGPLFSIGSLLLAVPSLSVGVRRLHDTGRSGWWILIGIIPLVNCIGLIVLIVWYVQEGNAHVNAYGDVPTNTIE
tara:strand:+ start:93 stop:536 length:444 start_codon:yes stop_codon:yes gene_type:complete